MSGSGAPRPNLGRPNRQLDTNYIDVSTGFSLGVGVVGPAAVDTGEVGRHVADDAQGRDRRQGGAGQEEPRAGQRRPIHNRPALAADHAEECGQGEDADLDDQYPGLCFGHFRTPHSS